MKRVKFKKTILIGALASSAMAVLALSGCSEKAHESDGKSGSNQSVIMGSGSNVNQGLNYAQYFCASNSDAAHSLPNT